jgi:Tfp pilus assembly protein PilP
VVTAPPSPIATAITPNLDPSETHALIGLLELGDRSAALLEVNGVPQRIQVGEKIGASGWQVVSITNQAALIQRNGEVRSIYVGQQF